MDLDKQRTKQNDRASDGSSNCHPFGEYRKMSIGVTVEASARSKLGAKQEDGAAIYATERVGLQSLLHSSREDKTVAEKRGLGVALAPDERESPRWLCSRRRRLANKENEAVVSANDQVDCRSLPPSTAPGKGMQENRHVEMVIEEKQANISNQGAGKRTSESSHQGTKNVQFYANRTSILQSDNGVSHKFDCVTYGMKSKTDGVEELAFTTTQEMCIPTKGVRGEKPQVELQLKPALESNQRNEALRMKLLDVLGSAPSQVEKNPNPDILKSSEKHPQNDVHRKAKDQKSKQNSDTIETDSESPNKSAKRPVTRSVARKKFQRSMPKLQYEITVGSFLPSTSYSRPKLQEKNIFAFDEVEGRGIITWPVNGRSSLVKNSSDKKQTLSEPRRIPFPPKTFAKKVLYATEKENTAPPPSKKKKAPKAFAKVLDNTEKESTPPPLFEKTAMEGLSSPPLPKSTAPDEDFGSPLLEKNDIHCPTPPKATDTQVEIRSPPLPKNPDSKEDFDSPPLPKRKFIEDYFHNSPPPSPQNTAMEGGFLNPDPIENGFKAAGFRSMKTSHMSKPGCSRFDMPTESSDDTRECEESPGRPSPLIEEEDAEHRLSQLSMEELDPEESLEPNYRKKKESFESQEFFDRDFRKEKCSPASHEKSAFMFRRSKRLGYQDTKLRELSSTSPSPKESPENEAANGLQGVSEENPENGLERAITQFALVLEKFKTKTKSETTKKSSEILATAVDRIHKQLQDFESQIQTNVVKFTSLATAKRKHIESRFQEQQERLQMIHEKFKVEVNQHLQDCRSTLEELEAGQIELKGNAERQRASHRKLLLQVEGAIREQQGEADKSIAEIHKASRKKMKVLKRILGECLKEGVLG